MVPVIEMVSDAGAPNWPKPEIEETLPPAGSGLTSASGKPWPRMAHRIVNKLLHQPTVRLKACAASGNGHAYANAVREPSTCVILDP